MRGAELHTTVTAPHTAAARLVAGLFAPPVAA